MALYRIRFSSELPVAIAMDDPANSISEAHRKPKRVTITIPYATYVALEKRSYEQGRSLSNLSAYLLECAVSDSLPQQPPGPRGSANLSRDGHRSR